MEYESIKEFPQININYLRVDNAVITAHVSKLMFLNSPLYFSVDKENNEKNNEK